MNQLVLTQELLLLCEDMLRKAERDYAELLLYRLWELEGLARKDKMFVCAAAISEARFALTALLARPASRALYGGEKHKTTSRFPVKANRAGKAAKPQPQKQKPKPNPVQLRPAPTTAQAAQAGRRCAPPNLTTNANLIIPHRFVKPQPNRILPQCLPKPCL